MIRFIYLVAVLFILTSCQNSSTVKIKEQQNLTLTGNSLQASNKKELDQLFIQLKVASKEQVIRRTQQKIRALWNDHSNAQIDTLMQAGLKAMYSKDYQEAIKKFSRVIQMRPDYAEGWNKRATVFFMKGDFQSSLRDIDKTLRLENRHFGALSGMASIYMLQGKSKQALITYERLHQVVPQLTDVNSNIQELKSTLGYRQI